MSLRVLVYEKNELDSSSYTGIKRYISISSIIECVHITRFEDIKYIDLPKIEWTTYQEYFENPGIFPLYGIRTKYDTKNGFIVHPEHSELCLNFITNNSTKIDTLIDSIGELINEIRYNPALGALSSIPSKNHFNSYK